MKLLLALLAIALLGSSVAACGGASKGGSSTSETVPNAATTSNDQQTTATSTTGTVAGGETGSGNAATANIYGHTASAADERAITALVKRYYAAVATANGAEACGLIYSIFAEAIPEDYGQPPGPPELRGKTCPVVMTKLFKHLSKQSSVIPAPVEVTGVLVKGRKGTVLLHSRAAPTGEIGVERERGVWKINALIGVPCTKCSPS